jgi:hypothetical protein
MGRSQSSAPRQSGDRPVSAAAANLCDMNTALRSAAAATTAQPSRFVRLLLADRHSLPLTIALHLVPGMLIVAAYYLVGEPLVKAINYPIFLAWAIALAVVLFPLMLGLLWLGKQRNGRYSMEGVVLYRDRPISRGKVTAMIAGLLVYMTVVSLALIPLDNLVFDAFFSWVPFEGAGGSGTTYIEGYDRTFIVVTLAICLPFTGFTLPLIEEYYFRGFLLPRIAHLGWKAPLLNTVLFSVYHFWAIWTVVSKLIFLFPGIFLAWKRQDIRLTIGMHPGSALLLTTVGLILLATGVM